MGELMSQSDFATRRGVGKSAVSNWKAAGLLVFAEAPGGKLLVDVERTEARLNAKVDPTRGRPTAGQLPFAAAAPAEPGDLPKGRTAALVRVELAEEQLIEKRQKNAQAAGELMPYVELERRGVELCRSARERVNAAFRGMAERLAAETEVRAIMAIGLAEFDRVFVSLAEKFASGAATFEADEAAEDADAEKEVAAQIAEA